MYSTTISSRGVRSDGQLHGHRSPPTPPPQTPPTPTPASTPPPRKETSLFGLSAEQILIGAIAFLLLQSEKPDRALLLALMYVLF